MADRSPLPSASSLILPEWASELPKAWTWYDLDKVCVEIVDCPHSTPEVVESSPYLMARTSDVLGGVLRLQDARRVSQATYLQRIQRAEPRLGDLLYSREGTYFGIAAEVPPDTKVCLGQRMVLLRPNPRKIEASYLRQWLNSPGIQSHIHGYRDGSVAERLNLSTIRRLPVCAPDLAMQRAIAHILGTLDDKIELNRRMSETLEAMARALFRSWFVDFDPVRAKAEGRDPGLPKHLADLFPDSFEDSELGEIPKGWKVGSFGDLVVQLRQKENPFSSPDTEYRHFSIPAFDRGQWPEAELGRTIKSQKSQVPPRVILLSKLNPEIERVWLVDVEDGDRSVCSTEFLVLQAKSPFGRCLAYCQGRSPSFRQQLEGLVTGTSKSHQRTRAESVLALPIVRPSVCLAEAFEKTAEGLLERTLKCRSESRTFTILRDTLLPKLISGELRVKDAERWMEERAP